MRRPILDRLARVGLGVAVLAGMAPLRAPAAAASLPPLLSVAQFSNLGCSTYPGGDTICSGEVPSFDGSPLDADLTLPAAGTSGENHPLMVMFHGFGNNKHEWESTTDAGDGADKYHWNSHWFAEQGYYVLTYTARGFTDQGTNRPDEPNTPAGTAPTCHPPTAGTGSPAGSNCLPSGTIRVKNVDVEIRDSQYLAALAAALFPDIDANQVAVSGGSYGGGESWLQASQPDWTFPNTVNPALPVLHLQVAVPKYAWTDLAYSLAPNGHHGFLGGDPLYSSSQGAPDAHGVGNPFGVGKLSYVTGLYTLGTTTGTFEEGLAPTPVKPPPCTPPETFSTWLGRVTAGEPYDLPGRVDDPLIAQVRQDFSDCHSAYYQPGWREQQQAGRETAVFSIQGWTDDLFEAVESFRMFKYLKGLDPLWPVAVAVADVGHSRAQNPAPTWQQLNDQANAFLAGQVTGSHPEQTTVSSQATVCAAAGGGSWLSATTPEGLANATLTVNYAGAPTLLPDSGVSDPNGPATDAITAGPGCKTAAGPATTGGGDTEVSIPLQVTQTYVGLGSVRVAYIAPTAPATPTAVLCARVWDVAPDGRTLLMSRGVYRFDFNGYDSPTGVVSLPFYGNHWVVQAGHRLRLDLEQADTPTYRASNAPVTSAPQLTDLQLRLPVAEDSGVTLAGGP